MATTPTEKTVDELLAGSLSRENFDELVRAIYHSYRTVDSVHSRVKTMLEQVEAGSGGDGRELVEKVGILLFALGEHEAAAEKLYTVRSRKVAAHFLGRCNLKLGRAEDALDYLQKGRRAEDDRETDILMIEAYCALRRTDEAEKLLKKLTGDAPDVLYARGLVADATGEYGVAMEFYEKALEKDPEHPASLFHLAHCCDLNGDDARAIELYERCTNLKPTFVGALMNLGVLYDDQGDYAQAIDCYKRVLAIAPRHAMARLYLKDSESSLNMYRDTRKIRHMHELNEIFSLPVSGFELSPRSRACLDRMDIQTLGKLTQLSKDQLLSEKNFGDTSLNEIEGLLARYDLELDASLEDGAGEDEVDEALAASVDDLELSTRCRKCMDRLGIMTIADLVRRTESELLAAPNFGATSLDEVKTKLRAMGLSLKSE